MGLSRFWVIVFVENREGGADTFERTEPVVHLLFVLCADEKVAIDGSDLKDKVFAIVRQTIDGHIRERDDTTGC